MEEDDEEAADTEPAGRDRCKEASADAKAAGRGTRRDYTEAGAMGVGGSNGTRARPARHCASTQMAVCPCRHGGSCSTRHCVARLARLALLTFGFFKNPTAFGHWGL